MKRLGLLAISGVRVMDEELLEKGLTLPGFVERSKTIASLPSLGLLTLAGLTPSSFDIRYLDLESEEDYQNAPDEFDIVAISSFSAKIKDAYRVAEIYRARGTTVILGGLHVTVLPDEAQQYADAIVIGEAEPVWPQLLEDYLDGKLQPRYDGRTHRFDLADAPMPRFDLLDIERYNRITVQTQRGCPHHCHFCAASMRLTPYYKMKPVDKVIAEIREIKKIWKRPFIEFADDNSFVNKDHSKALMRALIPEQIRWFTETDISVADDEELLALIRDAGCRQLLIGLETPSASAIADVDRWKAKQISNYAEAIDKIQSYGISVNGTFVLGLDGTGTESFSELADFIEETHLHEVQITIQTAFPGTELYDDLKKQGRILQSGAWELCTLFDVNFEPSDMTVEELRQNFHKLTDIIYSDEHVERRRSYFRSHYLRQPTARRIKQSVNRDEEAFRLNY